jgi:superfamily II DNA or RNA helicase
LELCGVLAKPEFESIITNAKIRLPENRPDEPLSESAMQTLDKELAKQTDLEQRRFAILNHILPLARDPQNSLLYFGPSVTDAEHMAYLLRIAHVEAAVISAKTKRSARHEIIQRFREGKIRVLCNCEVLTVGFDAPRVTHLVMARPTSSRVLYEQIVGRGLRGPEFGGTKTCLVLDCEDDYPNGRPELGYESFRKLWHYEEEAADLTDAQDLRDAFLLSPTPTGQNFAKQAAKRLAYIDKVYAMLHAEFGPTDE